jgi:hypothetical protein
VPTPRAARDGCRSRQVRPPAAARPTREASSRPAGAAGTLVPPLRHAPSPVPPRHVPRAGGDVRDERMDNVSDDDVGAKFPRGNPRTPDLAHLQWSGEVDRSRTRFGQEPTPVRGKTNAGCGGRRCNPSHRSRAPSWPTPEPGASIRFPASAYCQRFGGGVQSAPRMPTAISPAAAHSRGKQNQCTRGSTLRNTALPSPGA